MADKKIEGARTVADEKELLERTHPHISLRRQCKLLKINRNCIYYKPKSPTEQQMEELRLYAINYAQDPCVGTRRMAKVLENQTGRKIGRKRARRIQKGLKIKTLYRHRETSEPAPHHAKFPYLLRGLQIHQVDEVWTSDITYLPVGEGTSTCAASWIGQAVRF